MGGLTRELKTLAQLQVHLILGRIDERITVFNLRTKVCVWIAVGKLSIGIRVREPKVCAVLKGKVGVDLKSLTSRFTRFHREKPCSGSHWPVIVHQNIALLHSEKSDV